MVKKPKPAAESADGENVRYRITVRRPVEPVRGAALIPGRVHIVSARMLAKIEPDNVLSKEAIEP